MEKDITYNHNNCFTDKAYKSYNDQGNYFADEAGDYDYDCINTYGDHTSYDDEYYD
jgi:hypothetical protein